jgi:hypothetical protein
MPALPHVFRPPCDPTEQNGFAVSLLYSVVEIGDLAHRHVATPILDHPCFAMILEQAQSLARLIEVGPLVLLRHGRHETIDISRVISLG